MKKTKKKIPLNQLIKQWDKKLRESGFVDAEDRKTGALKKWSDPCSFSRCEIYRKNVTWIMSKADYFRHAGLALHSRSFKNPTYKRIWELHSEGETMRATAKKLSLSLRQVAYAVWQMEKSFGIKLSQNHKGEATQGSDHADSIPSVSSSGSKDRTR